MGYAVLTAVNGGSRLLIFDHRAVHDLVLLLTRKADHVAGSGSVIPSAYAASTSMYSVITRWMAFSRRSSGPHGR